MPPELTVRRLGAADAVAVQAFVRALSPQSRLRRFFSPIRELTPRQLQRALVQDDSLANFAAFADGVLLGMAQSAAMRGEAEFGVVVADAWQRTGIGRRLLQALLAEARRRSIISLYGLVDAGNRPMLLLARQLGFTASRDADPALVRVELRLGTGSGDRHPILSPIPLSHETSTFMALS